MCLKLLELSCILYFFLFSREKEKERKETTHIPQSLSCALFLPVFWKIMLFLRALPEISEICTELHLQLKICK